MQVISGNLKGLKLDSIKNPDVRPTKDRIKKSLFDILRFRIKDKIFLELFGGTGQIGIEAFSQGASKVIIVESDKDNSNIIEKNIGKIKSDNKIYLYNTDALSFLNDSSIKCDIVFLDPPYKDLDLLDKTFKKIERLDFTPEIIIVETLSLQVMPEETGKFNLRKVHKYGKISLNLYERK